MMVNNENRQYKRIIPPSGEECEENEAGGGGGERGGVVGWKGGWVLSSVGCLEPRNPGVQCAVPSLCLCVRLLRAAV